MPEDRIVLSGMVHHGYTGVLAFEKRDGQDFIVDVELRMGRIAACESDDLTQTVDYSTVFKEVGDIVERSRDNLIERVAGRIARRLLASHPMVGSVVITVKKPKAPIEGRFDYMAVTIERNREDLL
jgi:dihydroneopterin aldolase